MRRTWLALVGSFVLLNCTARGLTQEPPGDFVRRRMEALEPEIARPKQPEAANARPIEQLMQAQPPQPASHFPTDDKASKEKTLDGAAEQPGEAVVIQEAQGQSFVEWLGSRYDNGFVLVESTDPERVPFKLVVGNFAQIRYTNTQLDSLTFVDHLGVERRVDPRNDVSFNRDLLTFTGYAFDPDLKYNVIIWSSGSLASVVVAGGITYEFSKAFALNGGYNGLPGSRSLLGGFRDLAGIDRSMADTFFRPGFTQGVWATGEPVENLYYNVMIGNSLNTLQIGAAKIDVNMAYSGTVWWEPLGDYGPGQAYNDLEKHSTPVVRLGTCFTRSREDRFTDASVGSPENIQIHNSDGVLFFSTGALAPGVTVLLADYTMWAIDAGFKYDGLALNGQYFFRWLNDFRADGPLPINSIFDHGFEASVGNFFHPTVELYARTSFVFGEFRDCHEYCVGSNWYPLANRGLRVCGEIGRTENAAAGNIITPYQAGQSGWMFVLQAQLNF